MTHSKTGGRTAVSAAADANPWLNRSARIEAITHEFTDVATYHLRFTDPEVDAAYRFEAGQFNMLYVPGVGEVAIGVSSGGPGRPRVAGRPTWDHTVRLAGRVTGALDRLGVGGSLGVRGPYGEPWPLDACVGGEVLLVAGGTGLASLRAAVYELLARRDQFSRVRLLYGARTADGLLYTREYADWTAAGIEIDTTVDRGGPSWRGHVGVVTQLLTRLRPWEPEQTNLWCCGPEVMMRFVVRAALSRGLTKEQIWVSMERNMQCAVGLCGHCQFGPEMICKTGPVYPFDRIEPYLNVEGL